MIVLVLNAGSSSLKFQLIRTDLLCIANHLDEKLARGTIERVGGEAVFTLRGRDDHVVRGSAPMRDLRAAVEYIVTWLASDESGRVIGIDDSVLRGMEEMIELAPLHNPHNLKGVAAARAVLGAELPNVAVFDTAFHHTLPEKAYLYAIPYQLYRRHKVRRYGFHGTSHRYVSYRWRELTLVSREDTRIITLHLGNGCSACAIDHGNSVDTSMGFTPLEGLVMGTRSGDLDPAVVEFLEAKEGLTATAVDNLLNKQSGLLGISGLTNDMRDLLAEAHENDDRRARLAIDMFCYRARKYIGAYLAALGGADAIIFAGGIGENAPEVRAQICRGLEWTGIEIDEEANRRMVGGGEGRITTHSSRLAVWVIPTDEELLIARDTFRVVTGVEGRY
jgi:acetate kinase